eukprot:1194282-Prorocentrum_minimum.AAC.3
MQLLVRTGDGQCMLSETDLVARVEANPACAASLEGVREVCDVSFDAACCGVMRTLWSTFAEDGTVCVCNSDFGSYPTVRTYLQVRAGSDWSLQRKIYLHFLCMIGPS